MSEKFQKFKRVRRNHWEKVALRDHSIFGDSYHHRLKQVYRTLVPPDQRILEIGCGKGDLLIALKPSLGVGIDFSEKALKRARQKHHDIFYIHCDAHDVCLKQKFDFIILSDIINDLWDVQSVFTEIGKISTARTRIIMNFYSHLWEAPLKFAQKLNLMTPLLAQNWLTKEDVFNLLYLTGFETIRNWSEVLLPAPVPFFKEVLNEFAVKLWPFRHMALTNFVVARPLAKLDDDVEPTVSVIVPARNEEGNINRIFKSVPEMGLGTELIFVEGGSSDHTYKIIENVIKAHPGKRCKLFRQKGRGKGDAVRLGFSKASGEVLMILDADLTVSPDYLPRFFEALTSGKGELINGVRLIYPMEREAMRYINLIGNKFFSLTFSWLLGQPIKDTLCGTKVIWKDDYERIASNRQYFGDFDPFGDFDLLFGATKLNLKIAEMPIRYSERTYGDTNIQRWKHGWLLLRMTFFAARRIKFV
jgi:SAM-dependent methyltransferase